MQTQQRPMQAPLGAQQAQKQQMASPKKNQQRAAQQAQPKKGANPGAQRFRQQPNQPGSMYPGQPKFAPNPRGQQQQQQQQQRGQQQQQQDWNRSQQQQGGPNLNQSYHQQTRMNQRQRGQDFDYGYSQGYQEGIQQAMMNSSGGKGARGGQQQATSQSFYPMDASVGGGKGYQQQQQQRQQKGQYGQQQQSKGQQRQGKGAQSYGYGSQASIQSGKGKGKSQQQQSQQMGKGRQKGKGQSQQGQQLNVSQQKGGKGQRNQQQKGKGRGQKGKGQGAGNQALMASQQIQGSRKRGQSDSSPRTADARKSAGSANTASLMSPMVRSNAGNRKGQNAKGQKGASKGQKGAMGKSQQSNKQQPKGQQPKPGHSAKFTGADGRAMIRTSTIIFDPPTRNLRRSSLLTTAPLHQANDLLEEYGGRCDLLASGTAVLGPVEVTFFGPPENVKKVGLMIAFHGMEPTKGVMREWSQMPKLAHWQEMGMTLAVPNIEMSAGISRSDIETVINLTMKKMKVNSCILVGKCWGGNVCIQYALDHPNKTKGLILLAPLGPPRMETKKLKTPCLAMWADNDPIVPIEESYDFIKDLNDRSAPTTFKVIPETSTHSFSEMMQDDAEIADTMKHFVASAMMIAHQNKPDVVRRLSTELPSKLGFHSEMDNKTMMGKILPNWMATGMLTSQE